MNPNPRLFEFSGGTAGAWRVTALRALAGESLAAVSHVAVRPPQADAPGDRWLLRGVTSNDRYVEHPEKQALVAIQPALGRPQATRAALIPIRKSPAWWALTQDARRDVLEAQSAHIAIGMRYLPAIARRLHHCRDLASSEPFDFLTWFEFAPADEARFDELLALLRASPEWAYVDREVEIRLVRA